MVWLDVYNIVLDDECFIEYLECVVMDWYGVLWVIDDV